MEFKDKNVETAIKKGLETLNITEEDAVITVISEGGFLKKACVNIEIMQKDPAPAERVEEEEVTDEVCVAVDGEADDVDCTKAAKHTVEFLRKVALLMNAECDFEVSDSTEQTTIIFSGKDANALIGYRGDVLDAIQYLGSNILNGKNKKYKRLVLDCENYRQKREDILTKLAERLAEKSLRLQKQIRLEPMNPAERRVIHFALKSNDQIETESEGIDPKRQVIIRPAFGSDLPIIDERNNKNDRYDQRRGGGNRNRNARFGGNRGGFRGNGNGGNRNDNRRGSGFNGRRGGGDRGYSSPKPAKRQPFSLGFGSYLGNTHDNND